MMNGFFAALVTERMRTRQELERSAADLERRVAHRTVELSAANEQLAQAEHMARVGSWKWLVPENRISWSDELYRIHGYGPQQFPITFEKAMELVVPADAERILRNVTGALGLGHDHTLPDSEYRIVREETRQRPWSPTTH